jgi:hypothetical protein
MPDGPADDGAGSRSRPGSRSQSRARSGSPDGSGPPPQEPPDWWRPSTAPAAAGRCFHLDSTVERVTNGRLDAVLADLSAAAEDAGCRLSAPDRRADGSVVGTGVDATGLVRICYRWRVSLDPPAVRIAEERYLSVRWRLLVGAVPVLFGAIAVLAAADAAVPWRSTLAVTALLAELLLFVAIVAAFGLVGDRGPLAAFDGEVTGDGHNRGLTALVVACAPVVPAVASLAVGLDRSGLFRPATVAILGTAAVATGLVVGFQHRLPDPPAVDTALPAGSTDYLLQVAVLSTPLVVVELVLRGLLPLPPVPLALFVGLSATVGAVVVLAQATRPLGLLAVFRYGGPRHVTGLPVHAAVLAACPVATAGSLLLAVDVARRLLAVAGPDPLSTAWGVGVLATLVAAVAPLAYYWLGLAIQTAGTALATIRLDRRLAAGSDRPPPPAADAVDPPVVVVEDGDAVRAVTTGRREAILVPATVVEALEGAGGADATGEGRSDGADATGVAEDPLLAVLAHEEAHLRSVRDRSRPADAPDATSVRRFRDATLGLLAPFVGTLLLAPQAAVLGPFGFREREFRADAYAAERTSPRAVRSALRRIDSVDADRAVEAASSGPSTDDEPPLEPTPAGANAARTGDAAPARPGRPALGPFVPFTPFAPERTRVEHAFAPLFAPFAVSLAHPTRQERIARLDRAAGDGGGADDVDGAEGWSGEDDDRRRQ